RNVINYAERLKIPADLTSSENKTAQLHSLRGQFQRLNPGLPASGLRFSCRTHRQTNILTEVKVCYKPNGQYKGCAENIQENCPNSFAIKGSY
ncbi:MAG: ribonuclease I, partial [Acinetobacter sp.]|nr:ribonuclease I [Acinetobacter sp.]